MVNPCQPIFINNLYGLLKINTTDSSPCLKSRQWYFFHNYGYTLLIRFINLTHFILNTYIVKIYSIKKEEKTLVYELTNETIVDKEFQLDLKDFDSKILIELISRENRNISQTSSILIDYVFREISQSHFRRRILQDNSSSSFNSSQPAFIALLCVIAVLLVAIIITIAILSYRYCSHRKTTKKRHRSRHLSTDGAHLATTDTPSSTSSYSIRSTQQLFPNHHQEANENPVQLPSLVQSHSTLTSIIPSRRLQQSMIDAYLNDYNSFQPTTIDRKQLNSYLFIDLHSTSSETFPERNSKTHSYDNTTTSGYDTSTGGEDRNYKHSFRYHHYRRRRSNHQLRQRRRSTLAFKRSHRARFLMRERSLPSTLIRLPQLRQPNPLFHIQDQSSNSTAGTNNQELISTSLSISSNNDTEDSSHYIRSNYPMNIIDEEEKSSLQYQTGFFEKVSIHRGDESDMTNYEDLPKLVKPSCNIGDGIAYVNESIIV